MLNFLLITLVFEIFQIKENCVIIVSCNISFVQYIYMISKSDDIEKY